jgi:peptidoglycan/xylan/chitin deacetylase (PgdA/CDA1 family)
VTTGFVGGRFLDRPMLSRRQIVELADAGLSIGAHGHRHVALDTVGPAAARKEIRRSRDLLQDWLGRPVTEFAYPHGFHSRRTKAEVVAAGFTSACAVKQALSSPTDDLFALARIMPTGDVTAADLVGRLQSPRTTVSTGDRQPLRTAAYRYVRRVRREMAA